MTTLESPAAPGRRRPRRKLVIGVISLCIVLAAAAIWYISTGPRADTGAAAIKVETHPPVGEVLVDQLGQALYLFEPDEPGVVTCTGSCARKWPPLALTPGQDTPDLGKGVDESLIDVAPGEGGARVVTYAGWPLYRYSSDAIGEVTGHDKDQNGGRWYAVTATGEQAK